MVPSSVNDIQPSGRVLNILSSTAPLILVVPSITSSPTLSAALQIAHDLDTYHKLDSEIIDGSEALKRLETGKLGHGNLVLFGSGDNSFMTYLLEREGTPFRLTHGKLYLNGITVQGDTTSLFLHPHPTSPSSLSLIIHYNTEEAMERGLRLFPIRTGVTVPDWVITSGEADKKGAGGVVGAGYVFFLSPQGRITYLCSPSSVWGNGWSWNEAMSSF